LYTSGSQRSEFRSRGLRVLLSNHPEIRRLKRHHSPSLHGNALWASTWLVIDFIQKMSLPAQASLMEVGCGWGLSGIFCAKKYDARVVAVDCDAEVFPYLRLQARINKVSVCTAQRRFEGIRCKDLMGVEYLIGADICFWDSLVNPLRNLIRRAFRSGVKMVVLADPGRPPFETLANYFSPEGRGTLMDWHTRHPRRIYGKILKITSS
jgi:predicted nicotinamide N-methyase